MDDQYDLGRVVAIYDGSDGDATLALYKALETLGSIGHIAVNIFRAQKSSARAKVYRGGNGRGRYRGMAYDRKAWAMDNLDKALSEHAETLGISWGWGIDVSQPKHNVVLYVELPTGQVSFHTEARGKGPDFPGKWDGVRDVAPERVCRFVADVLTGYGENA
jgi:hypothetical protein